MHVSKTVTVYLPDTSLFSAMWFWILLILIVLGFTRLYFKHWRLGRYSFNADLTGKVIIVTGASAGIGKETTRELVKHGATVYMACRNRAKAEKVAEELLQEQGCRGKLVVMLLDLTSLSSVRRFVEEFLQREKRLNILINNAGMGALLRRGEPLITEDGIEETMQANHFGHFLLTNKLLDLEGGTDGWNQFTKLKFGNANAIENVPKKKGLLKQSAPSRIVNVSSIVHKYANFDVENAPCFQQSKKFSAWNAYSCSKLCNILFTRSLAAKLHGTGVTVTCLHPGLVSTEFGRDIPGIKLLKRFTEWFSISIWLKTAAEGAQTTLYCALEPELEYVSGAYFSDCKPEACSVLSLNNKLADKLWDVSANLTALNISTDNIIVNKLQ